MRSLQTGDTLLGRQVMALAIDPVGKVSGCKVVATSGDVTPEYGCEQASSEKFEANARPRVSRAPGLYDRPDLRPFGARRLTHGE